MNVIGLRLSRRALRVLRERGIFAQTSVSLHYQNIAKRYVVRGVESGGATGDIGRYVTFAEEGGHAIECLHPVESIGVNGPHAVVVAPTLLRLDMLRKGRTYELLISRHAPSSGESGRRTLLQSEVLFRGVHGRLEADLSPANKTQAQSSPALPTFYSLAGEEIPVPPRFEAAVRSLVNATNCSGCSHSHYVARRHSKKRGTEHEVGARLSAKDNDSEANRIDLSGGEREISAGFDSEAGARQLA
jgi:hypothetical protein